MFLFSLFISWFVISALEQVFIHSDKGPGSLTSVGILPFISRINVTFIFCRILDVSFPIHLFICLSRLLIHSDKEPGCLKGLCIYHADKC